MLRIFNILSLLCFLLSKSVFCQEKLEGIFYKGEVHKLLDKANSFYNKDFDSAIFYADRALSKINRDKEAKLYANAILRKSTFLWFKPEYKSAFKLLEFNIENQKNMNGQILGKTYFLIGNLFRKDNILDSSLVNYTKALKAFGNDSINHQDISRVYLEIGLIYSSLDDELFAQKFYEQSMKFSPKSDLIKSHQKFVESESEFYDYERRLELDLEILEIANKMSDETLIMLTYSSLAHDYKNLKQYNKALEYQSKILASHKNSGISENTNDTLYYMGELHLLNNNPKEAITFFKEAEASSSDSLRLYIYKNLKTAYVKLGNSNRALKSMESYDALKDSINSRNVKASIAEITAKYNDAQQKQEIQTLNFQNEAKAEKISNQRLTLFGTVSGSLLLLLLGYFGYKNYKSKQDLSFTQLNFKLLQTQLNPHFMFNALNEIKLNLDSKKPKESSEHLAAYSKLMRLILEGSNEEFVSLGDDVSLISKFLQLQQLVHNNTFEYKIYVDELLDLHYTKLPPMFSQPFVENAVLHGVKNVINGKITVNYKQEDDNIQIEIKDNGKGVSVLNNASGKQLHQSMGTRIIKDRVKNYNKLYSYEIDVETTSNKNSGTLVSITCPIKTLKK